MGSEQKDREIEALRAELAQVKEEAAHLKRQVMMAVNLRFHLMPNIFPLFPDLPEVDVYADQIGKARVGGDFFDVFRLDSDHIGILISDIFDGGDAAALFMVTFKLYLEGELAMGFAPEKLMEVINNRLARTNEDNLCLSAWYGEYEISTGRVRAVNAGHETPLILRNKRAERLAEDELSYLCGVMEGMSYSGYEFTLEPGDALVLYTDGMTKAVNGEQEHYTTERMKAVMEEAAGEEAEFIVEELQESLLSFIGDEELPDDITLLVLTRKGGADR
ncbi:MAG: serine/threonine-protein phosphatase [Lachnospiraceae bacterium]|nr:serine/threonine-protein phosphatase [Lachnospiraceae bacterium]